MTATTASLLNVTLTPSPSPLPAPYQYNNPFVPGGDEPGADAVWVILSGFLILTMQTGFGMVESGKLELRPLTLRLPFLAYICCGSASGLHSAATSKCCRIQPWQYIVNSQMRINFGIVFAGQCLGALLSL